MEDKEGQVTVQSWFHNKSKEEEVQTGRGARHWREGCLSLPVQSTGKDPALQTLVTPTFSFLSAAFVIFAVATVKCLIFVKTYIYPSEQTRLINTHCFLYVFNPLTLPLSRVEQGGAAAGSHIFS